MASANKQTRPKVLLLGPRYCGRSSLLEIFCSGSFPPSSSPTIFDQRHLTIELSNTTLDLEMWNAPGIEGSESSSCGVVSDMDCCVLVFAIDSLFSFRKIETWMNICLEVQRKRQKYCPFVLVGNKVDREMQREVSWSQAQTWARSHNMPYFEVSEWHGSNVQTVLGEIAHLAFERQKGLKKAR